MDDRPLRRPVRQDLGVAGTRYPHRVVETSESPIQVNDSLRLSGEQVSNLLSGRPAGERLTKLGIDSESLTTAINKSFESAWPQLEPQVARMFMVTGATEERTSKALGIDTTRLADLSAALWKRSFSDERDRRAGEGANAQKRGQVTRQMRTELEAAMKAAKHGDDQ